MWQRVIIVPHPARELLHAADCNSEPQSLADPFLGVDRAGIADFLGHHRGLGLCRSGTMTALAPFAARPARATPSLGAHHAGDLDDFRCEQRCSDSLAGVWGFWNAKQKLSTTRTTTSRVAPRPRVLLPWHILPPRWIGPF